MEFDEFVLAAATADLTDEPRARDYADAVEFRLDLAPDPLESLRTYSGGLELIATNRVDWEGGKAPDTRERVDALMTAVEHPMVGAVDVELAAIADGSARRVIDYARDHDTAVIVSTHDFEKTPTRAALKATLERAANAGDVGKLAVTATDRSDVLSLLSATHEATAAGLSVATMAMGETGRHSRAVAPLYGSRIGYAPVDPTEVTGPGQYDLATLADLVDGLRNDE